MKPYVIVGGAAAVGVAVAGYFLLAGGRDTPSGNGDGEAGKKPVAERPAPKVPPPLVYPAGRDATWKRVRWFDHKPGPAAVVRASADGRIFVTGGEDGRVILWDAETGARMRVLIRYPFAVGPLAISPDGKQVASAGRTAIDQRVSLWDAATGKRRLLEGHSRNIQSLAFSPDGKVLASGANDDTIRFWSAADGRLLKILKRDGKDVSIGKIRFSPDGRWLAVTPVYGNEVLIWDVATGRLRHLLRHDKRIPRIAFDPASKVIATVSDDDTAGIWSLETGKLLHRLEGHRAGVWSLAFSPDGRLLATGASDATARIWNVADGKSLRVLEAEGRTRFRSLAFGPNGRQLVASANTRLEWWDVETGRKIRSVPGALYTHLHRLGGDKLLGRTYRGRIRLWDIVSGERLRSLDGHTYRMTTAGLSADGKRLATGGFDNIARVWEVATGKLLSKTGRHKGRVGRLSWTILSPDGRLLATMAAVSKVFHVWDAATGKKLRTISGPKDGFKSIAFGPKGRLLLAGADDETVRLYDAATGKELKVFHSPNTHFIGPVVAVGPKGLLAAAGFVRGEIRIWAIDGGKLLNTIKDTRVIAQIAFSPDARFIATATSRGHVRIYDVITGKARHRLKLGQQDAMALDFSPDGKTLAAGGRDAILNFIDVASGKVRERVKTLRWIWALQYMPAGNSIVVANGYAGVFLLQRAGTTDVRP